MVIISGITFILLIVAITVSNYYTLKKIEPMQQILDRVCDAVREENWAEGEQLINEAKQKWEKTQPGIEFLFYNSELEELAVSITCIKAYIEQREKTEAIAQLSKLEADMSRLLKTEKLSFVNLF